MPYCLANDLLLPVNFSVPAGEADRFINLTAGEMDGKLGYRYKVPVEVTLQHEIALLKDINVKLATGRLIMAMALGGQSESVNAYAIYLVREAEQNLMMIANGGIDLHAPEVDVQGNEVGEVDGPEILDRFARIPGAYNSDEASPVDLFETKFMGGSPLDPFLWWTPGHR